MTLKNNLLAAFCSLSLVAVGCYDVQYPGDNNGTGNGNGMGNGNGNGMDGPIDPMDVVPPDPIDMPDPNDPNNPNPNPDPNNTDRAIIEAFSASLTEVEEGGASVLAWTMANATEGELREGLTVIFQIPAEMLETGTYEVTNITAAKAITISVKGADGQAVTNAVVINMADDPNPNPNPNPNDPGAAARALFDSTVAPVLQAKCSNTACHGAPGTDPTRFVPSTGLADFYDTVVSYDLVVGTFDKDTAPILTMLVPTAHFGLTYDAAEAQAVAAWLDAEYAWRATNPNPNPNPTGPGQISNALVLEWSGCMDLASFTANNVAEEWAYLGSGEGPCIRCHFNGHASFIASDETQRVFDILTTNKFFMLSYFSPNVTDPANARMEINTQAFARVANGLFPHIEHPRFDEQSDAMTALTAFYNETMARKAAGTCAPPRMTP